MFVPVRDRSGFQGTHHKNLIATSLIIAMLACSLFVCVLMNSSKGASLENAVHVKNENELKKAITSASSKAITIAFDNDITLTNTLTIPANKDITLTSNKANGYYKLIGADGKSTITVEGGVLKLDGIIVTHTGNAGLLGGGVYISDSSQLIMYSGEISGNTATNDGNPHTSEVNGGGVYNLGVFEMYDGKIINNRASGSTVMVGYGGGVYNTGTFVMQGGEISGNVAGVNGGGVCSTGTFTMSGGTITGNTAYSGGGIHNGGTLKMSSGKITSNIGYNQGGGVCNDGVFTMSGGEITGNSGNNAGNRGGGVYNCYGSTFDRRGGVISGNSATYEGNDVYPEESEGSSNDNNSGTSNTNTEPPDNNEDGTSNGNNESTIDVFSMRDVVIVGVGVVGIIIGVIGTALFFTSKKQLDLTTKKLSRQTMRFS